MVVVVVQLIMFDDVFRWFLGQIRLKKQTKTYPKINLILVSFASNEIFYYG